jgi:hypothetical protein
MAIAWKSASAPERKRGVRRVSHWIAAAGSTFLCVSVWSTPTFAIDFEKFSGRVSMGYTQLFIADTSGSFSPGGSLAMGAGIDYAIHPDFAVGIGLGFHLLGSRTVEQGSLAANLDYNAFEAVAWAHWNPRHLGPVGRVSVGPALLSARAELATAGGGAAFSDFAVEEVAPGIGLDVTLMPRSPAPLRAGVELGMRVGFLRSETWTLVGARLAVHY